MVSYLKIIRPLYCLVAVAAAWLSTLIAGAQLTPSIPIALGMLSVFLISAGGFAVNGFFDLAAKNKSRGSRKGLVYSTLLFAAGVVLSYFIGFDTLIVAVVATGLLIAYPAGIKNTILIGNLITSGLLALTFVYGGIIAGNYAAVLPLALLMFLANVGREAYKTIDDALGDQKYHANSMALRLGVQNTRLVANIFLIVAVIFSFVPYFLGLLGVTYMFFAVLADIVFLVAAIAPVRHGSKLIKIAMIVALIAFLAGVYSAHI